MKVGDLAYNEFFDEIYLIIDYKKDGSSNWKHWICLGFDGEIEQIADCKMNNKYFKVISEGKI